MTLFHPSDQVNAEGQLAHKSLDENRPPDRKPGDNYVIASAIAGVVIGAVLGVVSRSPGLIIAGVIAGGLAGTLAGSVIGNIITRRPKPQ